MSKASQSYVVLPQTVTTICTRCLYILWRYNFCLLKFKLNLLQQDEASVHKANSMETRFAQVGLEYKTPVLVLLRDLSGILFGLKSL